jgi:primosomal protein N' (replication factor Y)
LLSEELVAAVAETVKRGEQAILLHNRRGFATSMLCAGCGSAVECPECAVALTWHRQTGRLRCHWCDLSLPDAMSCPQCGGRNLIGIGSGTERIEATLVHHLPGVRVARLDRDTASGQRLLDTLQRFRDREIDVLVGTQMLAKGHDFPRVTLVGVVLAEAGLAVPDFRASERTFQLLTQVAGRAGRGEWPGTVLIQTFKPEHPAIAAVLASDGPGFAARESQVRRDAGYPPWTHLALIELRHQDVDIVRKVMELIAAALREVGAEVRGPVMASVAKVRGIWRIHALLRSPQRQQLHGWLRHLHAHILPGLPHVPGGLDISVDVDPQGLE